jgi:RimJ/RimL family protein N-acetyltransferase
MTNTQPDSTTGPKPYLKGKQVNLRGLRREDLPRYRGWLENLDALHFMESGWRPSNDKEMEDIYRISTEAPDHAVFVVTDAATGEPVGVAGLYLIQWVCHRAEFRILLGDSANLGRGFGTEACRMVVAYGFDMLHLDTIYLGVNAENERAIRSYRKSGFIEEGRRRQLIWRNGRYYDAIMMSILRTEYLAGAGRDTSAK